MTPAEFLRKELGELAEKFPSVHIKYGYDKTIFTHIVEILPLSEFEGNDSLLEAWMPLSFEFRQNFREEDIAFVSSDSTLRVDSPLFEFNTPLDLNVLLTSFYCKIAEEDFAYTFPTSFPSIMNATMGGRSILSVLNKPEQAFEDFDSYENHYENAA